MKNPMATPGIRRFLQRCLAPVSFLFLLSFSQYCHGQNYQWAHGLPNTLPAGGNTTAKGIKRDASGNIYVVGYFTGAADFDPGAGTVTLVSQGVEDVFLAKYDASGNYVYAKTIGGTTADLAYGMAFDASGNIFITGYFNGTVDFDPDAGTANLVSAGSADIFLAKYDASGNYIYAKAIGGTNAEQTFALAIDASNNILITGYFSGTCDFDPGIGTADLISNGNGDIFLAKYDASGNYIYAIAIGGTGNDYGYGIAVDASGNAYIVGTFAGSVDFDPGAGTVTVVPGGGFDMFLAKYDANGAYVYANLMGSTGPDMAYGVALNSSNEAFITGSFSNTVDFDPSASTASLTVVGRTDIFIARYNSSGNYVYAKKMGSPTGDVSNAIAVDATNNVYITGAFTGIADFDPDAGTVNLSNVASTDIFLARYNSTGAYVYAKSFGNTGTDAGAGIVLDASLNAYITGSFGALADFDPGAGTVNIGVASTGTNTFFGKYNSSGNYTMAMALGGMSTTALNDAGSAITKDASGNTYVAGNFAGTLDFDPGAGTAYLTATSTSDMFIAKYNSMGAYVYAKALNGTGNKQLWGITVDASGNVYITGGISGSVDFDPDVAVANLSSAGGYDFFFASYDAAGNYVYAKKIGIAANAEVGTGIAVDASGSVYITGYFNPGTVDFDPGPGTANLISTGSATPEMFLAKYDALGDYVYAKNMGGTSSENPTAIAIDGTGNLYITGYYSGTSDFDPGAGTASFTSASGSQDIFLAKYDASGNYVYAKSIGGTSNDRAQSITVDGSGNIYITGYFTGSADFDPGASTVTIATIGSNDIFLAKYDASGDYVYAKGIGGTGDDRGMGIAIDGSNNLYITGNFSVTTDFDPSASTASVVSAGSTDVFVAKYDLSGNYVYARGMGGPNADLGNAIAVDASGNTYVTGSFSAVADFEPGSGTRNLISVSGTDFFVARYGLLSTLPVNLLSFTAKPTQNETAIQLNWSTSNQTNHSYFEIERSKDGMKYEAIGRRSGCTNCNNIQQFELKDKTPYRGRSYYQLKSIDLDGKIIYSKPISVVLSDKTTTVSMQVFPTITERAFDVQIKNTESKKQVSIQVLNASGVLIQQQKVWLNKGDNKLGYTLLNQPAGLYYIRVADTKNNNVLIGTVIKK